MRSVAKQGVGRPKRVSFVLFLSLNDSPRKHHAPPDPLVEQNGTAVACLLCTCRSGLGWRRCCAYATSMTHLTFSCCRCCKNTFTSSTVAGQKSTPIIYWEESTDTPGTNNRFYKKVDVQKFGDVTRTAEDAARCKKACADDPKCTFAWFNQS